MTATYTENLYNSSIEGLKKDLNLTNAMSVPKLDSICLNVGISSADSDTKTINYIVDQLSDIAGQKAVITKSKKAISGFKLRENMPIGCKVTLRKKKMYQFIDKLVYVSLPRIRDFRGISKKGFNQSGHYTFGVKEHNIFLEVDLDNIVKSFGMNITIKTTSKDSNEALALLKTLKLPIK